MLGVAIVQTLTLRSLTSEALRAAQGSLSGSMTALRLTLGHIAGRQAEWSVKDGRLLLGETVLNGRNDIVDEVRSITGAAATLFMGDTRVATNVTNPDGTRGIGTKLAPGAAFDTVLRNNQTYRGQNIILGGSYITLYEPIRDKTGTQIGILFVGVPMAAADAAAQDARTRAIEAGVGVVVVLGALLLWLMRNSLRPLTKLAGTMSMIAGGDLNVVVPFARRSDQVGEMARALERLRDTSAHARHLEATAQQDRARQDTEKLEALNTMARTIETGTAAALQDVSQHSTAITAIADRFAQSAAQSGESAHRATIAAGEALKTSNAVATATEELTASIREISGQVSQTTMIVARAVDASETTRSTIAALQERVNQIGTVAGMIAGVAAKTNLLALNATIEAARAGEAGRGFAVVAGEVKLLAHQTAQSTEEINRQIDAVRAATQSAVAAVQQIEGTIGQINSVATSVAAAVEQQGLATGRIAHSVAETTSAAREVADRIREVTDEANHTGQGAAEVRRAVVTLNNVVVSLRKNVVQVVQGSVRAASTGTS